MRGKPAKKREIEPDIKHGSVLVSRLINYVMESGKKTTAQKIVYDSMDALEKKIGKPALEVLEKAVDNVGPQKELRSRRVGGANYQIPYDVKGDRRIILGLRWIIDAARSKKGKPMGEKLTQELLDAYNNTGAAITKKVNTHKMADANKAFAHFAW